MKILHIASGDLWAGAEAQVFQLVCALQRRPEVRVSAIVLNPGELADRLRAAGIAVTVLDENALSMVALLGAIRRQIKETGVRIVHTHRLKENILGAIAARFSGQAISVRTVHGRPEHLRSGSLRGLLARGLDTAAAALQSGIVGVSAELCDYLRAQFPPGKVFVIPNGIDSAAIARAAAQPCGYRRRGKWNVVLIGRLAPVKRVDLFLEAAALLVAADPGAYRFVVVGDGPLRAELMVQAERLGIAASVDFLGFQSNSAAILRQMDCLALTSDHEGLPMVLLEALALGVPVVAHAVGGLPEVLRPIPAQRLVTDHAPQGYASAVAEMAAAMRPGERASLLPARFEISNTAAQYAELYRQLSAGVDSPSSQHRTRSEKGSAEDFVK